MEASELKQLKIRWDSQMTPIGQAALLGRGASPFPKMVDGYIDLRGLVITEVIKSVAIRSVDLSGASLEGFGQFGRCSVEASRFCYATLPTNLGGSFKSCDFSSAKLTGAVLRGVFEDCDFTSANLSSVRGEQVRFVRCVFIKTNFSKAELTHCSFEDCRFETCKFRSGSLAFSKFIRSPIQEDALENTLMEKVVFSQ